MRIAFVAFSAVTLLAACEREASENQGQLPAPKALVPTAEAVVSDELPGLAASATGIAFWDHPALPFNSMLIVANQYGLVSYNMEDGNEVSRAPGINARGAAVSYLGRGPQAAGVVATFEEEGSAFKFFGVDNASRAFLPIEGGPVIRGNVRGFCFGRAADAAAPTLFVVQKSELSVFNLDLAAGGVAVVSEAVLPTPDDISGCTVDIDGVVLGASDSGAIYRIGGSGSFDGPFATAPFSSAGEIAVIAFEVVEGAETSVSGQIALLEKEAGALHLFDRTDGHGLGVVTITGTDEIEGVSAASAIGVTAGNLGGLYRNGAIALGVDGAADGENGPVIRMVSVNGVLNALSLPRGTAISPRGAIPEAEDDGLLIKIDFNPQ